MSSETIQLPSQIVDLDAFDESINILVYGPSGVGKTALAGTADKVLYLAVEAGTVSAKRLGSKAKVWPIESWEDLEAAYVFLRDNPDHGFDWVVIDSITQMQQFALRSILDNAHKENESRDLDIPAIQDHQKWQNMYKRFVLMFCALPVNCFFTALVAEAEDSDKEPFLTPDIQGKKFQISQYTCGQMSAYGYMASRRVWLKDDKGEPVTDDAGKKIPDVVRRITWMDTGKIRGKDRYQVLEPFTEDVTLQEITELIDGDVTREELDQFVRPKQRTRHQKKVAAMAAKSEGKTEDTTDDADTETDAEEPKKAPAKKQAAKKAAPKTETKDEAAKVADAPEEPNTDTDDDEFGDLDFND